MVTGDANSVFLDTNILVYANVAESPFHQAAIQKIQNFYDTGIELWISRQVLREFLMVLTRPQAFVNPRPVAIVIERVRFFQTQFRVVEDTPEVTEQLLSLMTEIAIGGRQVYDANIVATMLVYGIPQLLTHNTNDFARFSELITVLPLQD
ncbi:type II toxin-antitoxin system VapC family toxin [Nostoc sp. FACHB-87]|uniref:type II toxin-antitoxin system VapC family toxin n=1 Tax=Nostocales TaxID=1161 RepID=UPI00168A1263|nr:MULTISPECIES: type II toxin-antitoxin system VapC family toxin [Nostocales]MBD2300659.1 type II toxin-antitoxin system VapC family toxin [Nostoc sp. FACHB-190]MBD2453557.1 type II toxin-antitoxin system VapC family toxin [Nostoc sp. FACHB-87]MBD2475682.1 type II toxin-antitoxin system VapC family toxin [Anabaena sp. FACHB-83]MBD2490184.1 type II toxin-antitoxin system VapC family toxin [Aulosira sp. FACHB-615]